MATKIPVLIALVLAVAVSGCVSPLHEIRIEGHGDQVYVFDSDIREALRVQINDAAGVKLAFDASRSIDVVFDGSSQEDNAFFRVVLINLAKIPVFYSYEGQLKDFNYYYFTEANGTRAWFNESGSAIAAPALGTTLWLRGPATGAARTAVTIEGNTITLEGTSFAGLKQAGDRLTLAVFGINSEADIP